MGLLFQIRSSTFMLAFQKLAKRILNLSTFRHSEALNNTFKKVVFECLKVTEITYIMSLHFNARAILRTERLKYGVKLPFRQGISFHKS